MTAEPNVTTLTPEELESLRAMLPRKVLLVPALMEQWATRDVDGYRLRWDWGEPDAEGFYTPTIVRDMQDRLLPPRFEASGPFDPPEIKALSAPYRCEGEAWTPVDEHDAEGPP